MQVIHLIKGVIIKTIIFYSIFFILNVNASELIKLHVNKNHTFLTFVESLSGLKYVSTVPKTMYLSKYKNDIEKFVELHHEISQSSIKNHPNTKNLLRALYIESLKYTSFATFEKKIKGFTVGIGHVKLNKYFNYLNKLHPRFEKILWNKTYKGLIYRKKKLEKIMKVKQFDLKIKKVLNFYGVRKEDIGVMDIAFYPISYGNNINAYSMGNIESIGIFVGKSQDFIWMLSSTILHELSHSIYGKSEFVKKNFLNLKDKKRKRTINEVMATAIGAGWGYNSLTNKYPVKSWYNNKDYDKYGKIIYPKVKNYIDNNKVIDKEFAIYIKGLL